MSVAVKPIDDATDDRIACYNRKNYDFGSLKARSMAWFIQVAIRRDMDVCVNGGLDFDNPLVKFQGHKEIYDKLDALETLIRARHIIDEEGLETIGLTLYNFPTLSHFYVDPVKQAFVREATIRELLDKADHLKRLVLDSRLAAYVPKHDFEGENSERDKIAFVNQMTLSTLEKEAGVEQDEIRKEKLLLVDMAAPVTVLKQQFLKLLDRESRLKQGAYDDWEEYGILPYLDMRRWIARNQRKVKAKTRVELIYARRLQGYGPKKFEETTIPHIEKLMDQKGPVFRGLLAEGSDEFRDTIAWTQGEAPEANAGVAEETLKRWIPKSYPYNFPDLERTARTFPKSREKLRQMIDLLKIDTQKRSLLGRIRNMEHKDDGTGQLRAMEELLGKNAYVYPVTDPDEDDVTPKPSSKAALNIDDLIADAEDLEAERARH